MTKNNIAYKNTREKTEKIASELTWTQGKIKLMKELG